MITDNSLVAVAQEQISADLAGEAVILNLKSGVYYGLNDVGARIWELVQQQPRSLREIRDMLLDEYEVESEVCDRDLREILQELQAVNLIQINNADPL
jgi:hypothetical protein